MIIADFSKHGFYELGWDNVSTLAIVKGGRIFTNRAGSMRVIISENLIGVRRWLHVSFSRADQMPDYHDTILVRKAFIPSHRGAVQVFPPLDDHVNLHPYCLHLWSPLDGDLRLPDFKDYV